MYSRVHRASRRAPIPDTTSPLCGRTPASGGPQGPGTESKEATMSKCVPADDPSMYLFVLPTSGVPQNVVVVPLASRPSLQRPKSVRTMWPWESNRMFSGFRSLDLKTWLFMRFLPVSSLELDIIVHTGALRDQSSPVHDVKGVEVAKGTGNFCSVEPGSWLQEDPLPLEMIEQLERRKKHVINTNNEKL